MCIRDRPNLCAMGLANIDECRLPGKVESPKGCYGKAAERFQGKDTTGGHWEIAGLVLDKPFPTFPQGFPKPCIQEFEKRIGRQVIGNRAESGTKIIQELGYCLLYTSARTGPWWRPSLSTLGRKSMPV